jgi:hypothetical protein
MRIALATAALACLTQLVPANAQPKAPGHLGHPVMDNKIYSMVLVDQLEHAFDHPSDSIRFNGQSWIGGDYNRLWINTEGARRDNGDVEDTDVQVLYGSENSPRFLHLPDWIGPEADRVNRMCSVKRLVLKGKMHAVCLPEIDEPFRYRFATAASCHCNHGWRAGSPLNRRPQAA